MSGTQASLAYQALSQSVMLQPLHRDSSRNMMLNYLLQQRQDNGEPYFISGEYGSVGDALYLILAAESGFNEHERQPFGWEWEVEKRCNKCSYNTTTSHRGTIINLLIPSDVVSIFVCNVESLTSLFTDNHHYFTHNISSIWRVGSPYHVYGMQWRPYLSEIQHQVAWRDTGGKDCSPRRTGLLSHSNIGFRPCTLRGRFSSASSTSRSQWTWATALHCLCQEESSVVESGWPQ